MGWTHSEKKNGTSFMNNALDFSGTNKNWWGTYKLRESTDRKDESQLTAYKVQ